MQCNISGEAAGESWNWSLLKQLTFSFVAQFGWTHDLFSASSLLQFNHFSSKQNKLHYEKTKQNSDETYPVSWYVGEQLITEGWFTRTTQAQAQA